MAWAGNPKEKDLKAHLGTRCEDWCVKIICLLLSLSPPEDHANSSAPLQNILGIGEARWFGKTTCRSSTPESLSVARLLRAPKCFHWIISRQLCTVCRRKDGADNRSQQLRQAQH